MKNFIFGVVGVLLFASPVFASPTQAEGDDYRCPTRNSFYNRTDSLCFETEGKTPVLMGNGSPTVLHGSATYRHVFDDGAAKGVFCEDTASRGTHGDCAGNTTLVQCSCQFSNGLEMLHFPLVTATIDPVMTATGFNIGGDQVDDDGHALYTGASGATGRPFTIGDDSFYMCVEMQVDDVSGIDGNYIGFAIVSDGVAWNADPEALTDYAGIGIEGTAASGLTDEDVYITTELNNGGVSETDTTDSASDGVTHEYCTYVTAAGVTTFTFDGAAPTVTAAFTFDDGDTVVPYMSYLHTADLAGAVNIVSWEVGYW